jgi:hypothetical protein
MTVYQKKVTTAILLVVASVISVLLLAYGSGHERIEKSDLVRLDSLIYQELGQYSIKKRQIKAKNIQIGEFSRIHYDVRIPRGISKTQIQTDLHYAFYEQGISLPAKIIFPEKDLLIHFYAAETIIRSIELKTDTSLKLVTFPASMLFVADHSISVDLVEQVRDLGEFSPLVYRSLDPSTVQSWYKKHNGIVKPVYVWMNEAADNESIKNPIWLKDHLPQFASISSQITLVVDDHSISKEKQVQNMFTNFDVSILKFDNVILFDAEKGVFEYERKLAEFKRKAEQLAQPILLVELNQKTMNILQKRSLELKKYGVRFVSPLISN